jgi:hypothetical protein
MSIKNKTAAVLLSATILTAAHGQGDTCSIVDKKTVNLGLQEGISGRCSNNGQPITCFLDNNEGWQCDGPAGTLHGIDVKNIIIEACQCNLEQESEIREENELMSD